jgi:hypothetical protein
MNSLVLKPCRWVVFLAVITGIAPSPDPFLEAGTLAAGAPRAAPREACEVRRTAADFLESRLTLELFFVF